MQTPEFHFQKPNILKRIGERMGIYEVEPADIARTDELDRLFRIYPDLGGDPDIGIGNDGECQSWRGDRYWWKRFLQESSQHYFFLQ